MANRYAAQQREHSAFRTWWDAVVASAPMASLATGLGLGAVGYGVQAPGVAASGAVVCAAGLYVERVQARSLRRRRRSERLRARHEVTELRRTIAQLREDVDAFQRALLDTEAVFAARSQPLVPSVPARVAAPAPVPVAATMPAPVAVVTPAPVPAGPSIAAESVEAADDLVVVPIADVEATAWVQTRERRPLAQTSLPSQAPSPFVAAVSAIATSDQDDLVYAALAGVDDDAELIDAASPEHGRHVA